MKTFVITCTGDRPEALALCNEYMERQSHQDFVWIVVDDGEAKVRPRRSDVWITPVMRLEGLSLVRNLTLGLEYIAELHSFAPDDLVILVEDDDWYHAGYIGLMQSMAANLPKGKMLWGESHTRYYNVRWRTYRENPNEDWASLCSTCFTTEFLPSMMKILDEIHPERPFIDVEAFTKHPELALLCPSNLVCGIKGMPGRKGIGVGHREKNKRLMRDPYLEKLQEWIGRDATRYREFYHHKEMRGVPIPDEQRSESWAMAELKRNDEGFAGDCGLWRQPTMLPDLTPFAAGAFAHGYLNEFHDIHDARSASFPKYDLIVLSGGLSRHQGLNGEIHKHYRSLGVPVVICEPGRAVEGTQTIAINKKGWLPPELPSRDRMRMLGLDYQPKDRGEDILIAGQRAGLDNQLTSTIEEIAAFSDRKIIFRPHPNMYEPHHREEYDVPYDELSYGGPRITEASQATLEEDLDRAHLVVTHSSNVGIQALMRGIPVIAHPSIVCIDVCWGLGLWEAALELDTRPAWDDMLNFLRRWSYTIWYERELRDGSAFAYLKQYIKREEP